MKTSGWLLTALISVTSGFAPSSLAEARPVDRDAAVRLHPGFREILRELEAHKPGRGYPQQCIGAKSLFLQVLDRLRARNPDVFRGDLINPPIHYGPVIFNDPGKRHEGVVIYLQTWDSSSLPGTPSEWKTAYEQAIRAGVVIHYTNHFNNTFGGFSLEDFDVWDWCGGRAGCGERDIDPRKPFYWNTGGPQYPSGDELPSSQVSLRSGEETSAASCRIADGAREQEKTILAARDPNEKGGSPGAGDPRYLAGLEPLRYAILFENQVTATAPAQEVVITDHLDATTMDLSTLSLGPISFGDMQVTPPPGLRDFATDIDLRPAQSLIVRIAAGLDDATGVLSWRFTSIDPATGQLTEDPLGGFLPPNVNPPRGEGSVLFTVKPRNGLPSGTEIRNRARIVFDLNAPVDTPEWLNTLDNTPPTSRVLALPETQSSPTFTVRWAGTDFESGIQDFTILVSEDAGAFTALLTNTPETSATFTGQPGRSYSFFSVARDRTGNVETKLPVGEATTRIVGASDTTPPMITASVSPVPNANGWNNSDVTVSWSVADAESGIASSTGCESATLAAETAGTTIACTATNGAALFSSQSVSVRIDRTPPVVTANRTPGPNAFGWNNTDVTARFEATDALSGLAGPSVVDVALVAEGPNQSATRTFTDLAGNSASATVSGINIDKTPPAVGCTAKPNTLWPPNHMLVTVNAAVTVTDSLSGPAGSTLTSVTSNEPDDGLGDGDTPSDIQGFVTGTPDTNGQLRAERSGTGTGRIYRLIYQGLDKAGNSATCNATVTVPHDRGK